MIYTLSSIIFLVYLIYTIYLVFLGHLYIESAEQIDMVIDIMLFTLNLDISAADMKFQSIITHLQLNCLTQVALSPAGIPVITKLSKDFSSFLSSVMNNYITKLSYPLLCCFTSLLTCMSNFKMNQFNFTANTAVSEWMADEEIESVQEIITTFVYNETAMIHSFITANNIASYEFRNLELIGGSIYLSFTYSVFLLTIELL